MASQYGLCVLKVLNRYKTGGFGAINPYKSRFIEIDLKQGKPQKHWSFIDH